VLIKAMEMLTRSRVYLVQSNLGLAKDEILAARELLAEMSVPEYQQTALAAIIDQLDLAAQNLPDFPILASENLEVAWQLLRSGLPTESEASAALESPLEATAPAEPATEATPTPTVSPEATSTPKP
jgi:hypothetical protein